MEVLAGSRQRVRSRGLEVRSKRDDVASRSVRGERDAEDVTSAGNGSRIDRGRRAAGTRDTSGVSIRGRKRQTDRGTEANRAVCLVERGGLRDRRATRQRDRIVSVT